MEVAQSDHLTPTAAAQRRPDYFSRSPDRPVTARGCFGNLSFRGIYRGIPPRPATNFSLPWEHKMGESMWSTAHGMAGILEAFLKPLTPLERSRYIDCIPNRVGVGSLLRPSFPKRLRF